MSEFFHNPTTTDSEVYGMHPRNIFICYSGEDILEAESVARRLELETGWTCWYEERNIPQNRLGDTKIVMEMIEKCTVFLLLSSSNTINSHDVQMAISQAMALGKQRLEIKIDEVRSRSGFDSDCNKAFILLNRQLSGLINKKGISYRDLDYADSGGAFGSKGAKTVAFLVFIITIGVSAILILEAFRLPADYPAEMAEVLILDPSAHADSESGLNIETGRIITIPAEFMLTANLAQQGDTEAQYEFANMFVDMREYESAAYWYRLAAESGHLESQIELGFMYRDGRGVTQNQREAINWFYKAAEQGDAEMQTGIAWLYMNGSSIISQNIGRGLYWYRQAAQQDHIGAQIYLAWLYFTGLGQHLEVDLEQTVYWFRRAAELGSAAAQNHLGTRYILGQGVETDHAQAAFWYRQAAKQDYTDAQFSLAWLYENGWVNGSWSEEDVDLEQAFYWYHRAAELGHIFGQVNAGLMYMHGRGVAQCYEQAAYWFRQVAIQDDEAHVWGAAYLGLMYEQGTGVEQDYNQALYWYERAVINGPEWLNERLGRLRTQLEQ